MDSDPLGIGPSDYGEWETREITSSEDDPARAVPALLKPP